MASQNGSKNGARAKDKVRVAIIGVGNCANSLLQGVEYYKDASPEDSVPGLMHVDLGGYHISDIEFIAAFDVVKGKVGVDLADAIWAHPNDTIKFADVTKTGVKVSRGMTHDGIGKYLAEVVEKAPGETDDVVGILKETGTDVVVNYLPVGSEAATKWYAEQILDAGVAMVNCMPVFIAREPYWQKRFEEAGLPIIGDDIKSQVGATITHRVLTTLFGDRGVHLDRTMQLNVGGNSDFLQHARARPPRVEEDLEDERRHVDARLRHRRGERPRRPVRLRAVADRPQVGVHPHGGLLVRRRAAQRRAQARGLGLAELGRHRHRRRPAREARAEQRHRRPARGAELVPDEVAAEADPRRRGARATSSASSSRTRARRRRRRRRPRACRRDRIRTAGRRRLCRHAVEPSSGARPSSRPVAAAHLPRHAVRLVAAARRERRTSPGRGELRALGHDGHRARAVDRARATSVDGRRALQRGAPGDVVALGPALPSRGAAPWASRSASARTSRSRSRDGPLRRRPRLRAGPAEPLLPRAPRRRTRSPSRRSSPPTASSTRRQGAARDRLLGALDALLATSEETAEAARSASPATTGRPARRRPEALPAGGRSASSIVVELEIAGRAVDTGC